MIYFSFYFQCAEYWVKLGTIGKNSVQNIGHLNIIHAFTEDSMSNETELSYLQCILVSILNLQNMGWN